MYFCASANPTHIVFTICQCPSACMPTNVECWTTLNDWQFTRQGKATLYLYSTFHTRGTLKVLHIDIVPCGYESLGSLSDVNVFSSLYFRVGSGHSVWRPWRRAAMPVGSCDQDRQWFLWSRDPSLLSTTPLSLQDIIYIVHAWAVCLCGCLRNIGRYAIPS